MADDITHRARCFLAANACPEQSRGAGSPVVYFSAELIGGGATYRLANGKLFRLTRADREHVAGRVNFILPEACPEQRRGRAT